MATNNTYQVLILDIQKKLLTLSRDQLQTVVSILNNEGFNHNVDVLSVPELRRLIVDFITSGVLRALPDEGVAKLHLLDDLISDLLASGVSSAGDQPTSFQRTDDSSASHSATPVETPTASNNEPQQQQKSPAQSPAGAGSGPRGSSIGKILGIAGTAVLGGIGAVALAPVVLGAVGFTSAGIAAGSYAASMMSAAAIANGGGVAVGSMVALLQSAGAVGLSVTATAAVAGAGAGVGAGVGAGIGAAAGLLAGEKPKQNDGKEDDEEKQKDDYEKNKKK